MFDPYLLAANVQWAEIDYDRARAEHVSKGTDQTLTAAVTTWQALERARHLLWYYGTLMQGCGGQAAV